MTPNEEEDYPDDQRITVGEPGDNKGNGVVIAIFIVIIVSILLFIVLTDEEENDDSKQIGFTDELYQVPNNKAPIMPKKRKPPKPVIESEPDSGIAVSTINEKKIVAINDKAEERRRLILKEQRKRSKMVVFKKSTGNSSGRSRSSSKKEDKIRALKNDTLDALKNFKTATKKAGKNELNYDTPEIANVVAGYIYDKSFKLLQGKIIPGILETAISTELSGMLRASVSENVYSEDGRILLIPKGSRLIGQYMNSLEEGQTRVFVIWSRMLRPDGIDIKIDSPGTDTLGITGLTGNVDTHFFKRFGTSILLSVIDAISSSYQPDDNSSSDVSENINNSAEIVLQKQLSIQQTIHVLQGSKINIFVAKDLNFKNAILLSISMKDHEDE